VQADGSGEDNDDNENGEEDPVMGVPEPVHPAKRARINGKQHLFAEDDTLPLPGDPEK
jgi:hypothetical protein